MTATKPDEMKPLTLKMPVSEAVAKACQEALEDDGITLTQTQVARAAEVTESYIAAFSQRRDTWIKQGLEFEDAPFNTLAKARLGVINALQTA